MGGIIWQLLIITLSSLSYYLVQKTRTLGSDLGASVKALKKAIGDEAADKDTNNAEKTNNDADFDTKNLAEDFNRREVYN